MPWQMLAPVPNPRGSEAHLLNANNSPLCASVPVPVPAAELVPMQRQVLAPVPQPREPEAHELDASHSSLNGLVYASNIHVRSATAGARIRTSTKS